MITNKEFVNVLTTLRESLEEGYPVKYSYTAVPLFKANPPSSIYKYLSIVDSNVDKLITPSTDAIPQITNTFKQLKTKKEIEDIQILNNKIDIHVEKDKI